MKCPKCRFDNPEVMKFCGECGYDLRQTQEPISDVYSHPQSYTPKHLADKILTTRSAIEGERKTVTVLFADVANYTSMSEKLDPEGVHQVMDMMSNIVICILPGVSRFCGKDCLRRLVMHLILDIKRFF